MRAITIIELTPGNFIVTPQVLPAEPAAFSVGPDSFVSTELGMKYSHSTDAVIDRVLDFFKTLKEQIETP